MADPIAIEIVEDARAQPHHSSFDPVTCDLEVEKVAVETVEHKRVRIDPKLLRAIVSGDLILFKNILRIEVEPTKGDGNCGLGGVTCSLVALLTLFNKILGIEQAPVDQDVESIQVADGGNSGFLGVTCGGNTALHVVAGAVEKPRKMVPLSEHIQSSGAVGLAMVSFEIVVAQFISITVSLLKAILFVFPIARICKRIVAAPGNIYFPKDYAEIIHGILFWLVLDKNLTMLEQSCIERKQQYIHKLVEKVKRTRGIKLILYFLYSPYVRILNKRRMYLEIAEIIYHRNPTLLSACSHAMKETPLHCAAWAGNLEMVYLLIQFARQKDRPEVLKEVLRAKNHVGETALHEAARSGYSGVVKALLGADVELANLVDDNGISPLYLAVVAGCFDVVHVLIASNHPTSYAGPDEQTALHAAVMRQEELTGAYYEENIIRAMLEWNSSLASTVDKEQNTPLHYASRIGNSYAVKKLLLEDTMPVYKPNSSGSFPVHLAAEAGDFTVIKELLNSCPDVGELLDTEERNFLHVAVEKKRTGVIMLAYREGINAKVMNAKDKDGNTALHLAVINSDSEIFAILSQNKKVNPNIRNKAGLTPLDISTSLQDRQFTYSLNPQSIIHRALLTRGAFQNPCQLDISKLVDNLVKRGSGVRTDQPNQREGKETRYAVGVDVEKESTKYENMSKSLTTGAVLIASVTFVAIFTVSGVYRSDYTSHTLIRRRNVFKAFVIADMLAFICAIVSTSWMLYSALTNFHLKYRKFYFQRCTPMLYWAINLFILAFGLGGYIAIAPLCEWLGLVIVVISGIAILWNFIWYPKFVPLLLLAPYLSTELQ